MPKAKLLNLNEAAAFLRVHRSSVYRFMNEDATFPQPVRIGRSQRFFEHELEEYVFNRRVE